MKKFIIFAVIGLLIALLVEPVLDKAMKSDEDTKYIEKILSDDSKLKKDYGEVESYSIVSKGRFSGSPSLPAHNHYKIRIQTKNNSQVIFLNIFKDESGKLLKYEYSD
ncbi:hypothetical protein IIQ44_03870 [Acinetobacter oleivorans]|uniref:Uncharacterized protein n=1 Tax=Acinetobacter calcoaceticus TaxID=471 RepID=A0A446ZIQ5_ACICA|nr:MULTISPECIES: hypothetical protein [Acinetobacter]MBE2171041.1 hypothetical protein [Acinetobacter oleivorans]MDA3542674.1 hypothetical protein [Acinetobacter sp. AOR18_HL]MEB3865880.1 hypothetical protein [Acinetobacter sp. IK31]VAX44368.1 Uncharacterised protein [Acinetobacter calcoaceticus]